MNLGLIYNWFYVMLFCSSHLIDRSSLLGVQAHDTEACFRIECVLYDIYEIQEA